MADLAADRVHPSWFLLRILVLVKFFCDGRWQLTIANNTECLVHQQSLTLPGLPDTSKVPVAGIV